MKNKVYFIFNLISVFVLVVLLCLLGVFGAVSSTVVYAAESPEVLRDLRKDKTFNESDYPYVADDYGLHVFQIAESSNKELFVYVYQPCHDTYDLVGTKISISYGYSVNGAGLTPKLYNLKLVSTSGTLDKYYVEGFTVPNDGDRYYNIVEIFRVVNSEIDEIDEAFPKTDIAYSVGQQWYVCDLNKSKHYEMNTFDTLLVDTVFNGNLTVRGGFQLGDLNFNGSVDKCDIWVYCFNAEEYQIKHIFDADLNYSIRDAFETVNELFGNNISYRNEQENKVITLTDKDVMSYTGRGLGSRTHEWNRILSAKEFVSTVEKQDGSLTAEQREKILSSQWVFSFLETERVESKVAGTLFSISYSDVYDVGLLRLHFQDTSGNYYDLGVVNSLTDPDNIADGEINDLATMFEEFFDMFMKIILIILGVILAVVLLNFVPGFKSLLKWIWNGIKYVISVPFRLLKSIFKK